MRPIVAKDLMSPDVLTISADLTTRELASFFLENEITGAPVEGERGAVIGVVSLVDLARANAEPVSEGWGPMATDYYDRAQDPHLGKDGIHIIRTGDDQTLVRDIMNPELYSVGPHVEVSEIADKMLSSHIHRLLVIEDNELIGLITTSDLLGLLIEEE